MAYRNLGTGSGHAADGAHTHAGTYASTSHAATHAGGGSDPITSLGALDLTGAAAVHTGVTPANTDETSAYLHGMLMGYFPFLARSTRNATMDILSGDPFFGPIKWCAWAGTTAIQTAFGPSGTQTATSYTLQSGGTAALPRRGRLLTASSANAEAGFESTETMFFPGAASTDINSGFVAQAIWLMPDSSYANSGASTGTRFFFGLTDQTATNSVASDNPAGNRWGFSYCNVNGGLTNTNIFLTQKNNTTETRTDSGIALAQNKLMRATLHAPRNWQYWGYQLENLTDGTSYGNTFDGTTTPLSSSTLRLSIRIRTINAVGRNIDFVRMSGEIHFNM